jgi:flagellar basal-body rod modification protein FlgD
MSSAVNAASSLLPRASAAANQPATTPVSPLGDPLANEQTFLKLLVSQLQNQDPLNPTDSNQFVSQLTSYSQLEQLIGIRQNTAPAVPATTTNNQTTAV